MISYLQKYKKYKIDHCSHPSKKLLPPQKKKKKKKKNVHITDLKQSQNSHKNHKCVNSFQQVKEFTWF